MDARSSLNPNTVRWSILHLVSSLEIGGLERMVLSLAAAQMQAGHTVHIGCLLTEGALAREARTLGIPVMTFAKKPGPDIGSVLRIRHVLSEANIDVLHSHNAMPHYYGTAAAIGMGLRRIVNTRHNMGIFPYSARREALYRMAMLRTDYGVSVCEAARKVFVARKVIPSAKAVTIVNGIDVLSYPVRNEAARQRLVERLSLPRSAVVAVTVGRLTPVKNHRVMLEAIGLARSRGVELALLVVGDGPLRAELEALAVRLGLSGSVRFMGLRRDVPSILEAADVFLQSSLTEGYSLALVEASSAALPIVATDVGGNAEIVEEGRSGLLVPANDVRAQADALERLCRDGSLRTRMGMSGRHWAATHGSVQTMHSAYLELYGKLVR